MSFAPNEMIFNPAFATPSKGFPKTFLPEASVMLIVAFSFAFFSNNSKTKYLDEYFLIARRGQFP